LCIAYDNFQYYQHPGAQRLGDADELRQFTTGRGFLGLDIPADGLRQDMLDNSVLLDESDIIFAEGTGDDDVNCQISKFFITEAIREAYPSAVAHVFNEERADITFQPCGKDSMPKMPSIDPPSTPWAP
jgi:hypothetical protein